MTAMTSTKRTSRKKSKRVTSHTAHVGSRNKLLSNLTDECLNSYFESLNGHKPGDLYQLVIGGYSFLHPEAGGGVAYFAHLGGIAFGLLTVKLFAAGRRKPLRPSY